MNMNKIKLLFLLLFVISASFAQDLSKLTPEQLDMYKKYMAGSSLPVGVESSGAKSTVDVRTMQDSSALESSTPSFKFSKLNIFGSYLFNTRKLSFEPRLNIPTPQNYILGTYDEIILDISGLYDVNYKLKINTEGNIRIPNAGLVKIAGLSIETASKRIKSEISKYYQGVASGETKVTVSLGNIRSIQVIIVGEAVKPGTYTLPSLATAFNALYSCGGPNEKGSMRDIKIIRNGKIIGSLDVYGLLTDQVKTHDIALQDGDIIRIEPYQKRVYLEGALKRIGTFESVPGENLKKIINFAGGFTETADKSKIRIFSYTDKGRTSAELNDNMSDRYFPEGGDSIYVPLLFENKIGYLVNISGAVRQPGIYPLTENVKLRDILVRAGGFSEMAYTDSVEVIREVKNGDKLLTNKDKSFVLKITVDKNLNFKNTSQNIDLQNGDQIVVRTIPGFEEIRTVRVEGEVKFPGTYNIKYKMERVSDVIYRAGGTTEFAFPKGSYLIRNEVENDIEKKLNRIIKDNTKSQLEKNSNKSIDANLLKNYGGNVAEGIMAVDSIQTKLSGSGAIDQIFRNENVVGLNLTDILSNKTSKSDLILEQGDIIYVPRQKQTIKVLGQVLFPTMVNFDPNFKLNDYILNAGGFTDNANKNNIFVVYSNSNVKGVKKVLFFRSYPKIEPGCQIIVPEKPVVLTNKISIGETIGILTSVSSTLALIYSIILK